MRAWSHLRKSSPIFKRSSMHSAHTLSSETFMMSTMWDLDLRSVYTFKLTWWSKHHIWPAIVSYYVAHFRKHQSSNDPSDWYNVDIRLFAAHMTHSTLGKSVNSKDRASDQSPSICRNWNDVDKGCVWKKCTHKHVCLKCAGDHPAFKYTRVSKSV